MKNNFDIKPTNWGLIARLLFDTDHPAASGENGAEELSENEKAELSESRLVSKKIDLYYSQKKYSETKAWELVRQRTTGRKGRKLPLQMVFRIAAAVVFAVLLGALGYQYSQTGFSFSQKQLVAADQPVNSFELPDGTKVSLNSDSKLYFPKKFKGNTREVTLEGEAFFDVEPNPNKPFIINAGKAQVKVVGTSFNVNAYPGSDKVEVIVETGKVRVIRKTANASASGELILTPGDKGTLSGLNDVLLKSKNDDDNFLAWKTHFLTFRETPLETVVATLEEVYKTDIDIADEETKKLQLTGTYDNYSLDSILEIISSALHLEVKKEDNRFLILKES